MRWMTAWFVVLGCTSAAEKRCFDTAKPPADRVSSCGEACNDSSEACVEATKLGTESCLTKHDAEVCRWLCLYGRTGKDLYCAEYTKITGHSVDEVPP